MGTGAAAVSRKGARLGGRDGEAGGDRDPTPARGKRVLAQGRSGRSISDRSPGGERHGSILDHDSGHDPRLRMKGRPLTLRFMVTIAGMMVLLFIAAFVPAMVISNSALDEAFTEAGAQQVNNLAVLGTSAIQTNTDRRFLEAKLRMPETREYLSDFFSDLRTSLGIDPTDAPYWGGESPGAQDDDAEAAAVTVPENTQRIMTGYQLHLPTPEYLTLDQVRDDIARTYAFRNGMLQRQQPDGEMYDPEDAPFGWDPSRTELGLYDAYQRYLADRPGSSVSLFRGYVDEVIDNLVMELQRPYHNEFEVNYMQPLVGTQVVAIAFDGRNTAQPATQSFYYPQVTESNREALGTVAGDPPISISSATLTIDGEEHDVYRYTVYPRVQLTGDDGQPRTVEYAAVMYLDADQLESPKRRLMILLVLIFVLAVGTGVLIAYFLAHGVTRPINQLVSDVLTIAQGNFGHRVRVKANDEIGTLAHAIDMMSEGLLTARGIAKDLGAVKHDLNVAEDVVIHLLPDELPKIYGYDIAVEYRPSRDVGGDYYDFFQIDKNHVGMIVADVSGKGVPGALVMTMARTVIKYESQRSTSPAQTFIAANQHIARDIKRGMFVTALYLVLNTQTGEMMVASAGHPPMLVWRANEHTIEPVNPNGIALGFDKGPIFERTIREQKVQLYSGDRVVLYTDGVTEAMSPAGEDYGDQRLQELVQRSPQATSSQLCNLLIEDLSSFSGLDIRHERGGGNQHDDITIVTFKLH